MGEVKNYKAFVSYSHADSKVAHWIHRKLETYKVPKHLVGTTTSLGPVEKRLGSIFIDRQELSASGNLTVAVREALENSDFLIVICSPDAAASLWVNKEVNEFLQIHGGDQVLCLIVGGEPLASLNGADDEECFPQAFLRQRGISNVDSHVHSEPIAADLRPQKDGSRLARLKLVAGLLGVGLDALVQRDTQRRQKVLFGTAIGSLAGVFVMLTLTIAALFARADAEIARSDAEVARSDAEDRRAQAEDLLEFMLVDLRDKLGPVDRLDVLDAVGNKALSYYAQSKPSDMDADSLARQARALHLLGEIHNLRGDQISSARAFRESRQTTAELLERAPNDPERIFNHAQSVFWEGFVNWQRGDLASAETSFRSYLELSQALVKIEPDNVDWLLELAYANSNLGTLRLEVGDAMAALQFFLESETLLEDLVDADPARTDLQIGLADTHAWLSSTYLESGQLTKAQDQLKEELWIYNRLLADDPNSRTAKSQLIPAHFRFARLLVMKGEVEGALTEFETALHLGEERIRDDPENAISAQIAGTGYIDYAKVLMGVGRLGEAEKAIRRAEKITEELLRRADSILKWQVELHYQGLIVRANLDQLQGETSQAISRVLEAAKALKSLRLSHPDNDEVSRLLAKALLFQGQLKASLNEMDHARAAWEESIELLSAQQDRLAPEVLTDLAWANFELDRREVAEQIINKLEKIGYRHSDYLELRKRTMNESNKLDGTQAVEL